MVGGSGDQHHDTLNYRCRILKSFVEVENHLNFSCRCRIYNQKGPPNPPSLISNHRLSGASDDKLYVYFTNNCLDQSFITTRTDICSQLRYGSYCKNFRKIHLGFVWFSNNEQISVHMALDMSPCKILSLQHQKCPSYANFSIIWFGMV